MTDSDGTEWQLLHASPLLTLLPAFLTTAEATEMQHVLEREIEWTSPVIKLYGRQHTIPRSQCWMGDGNARYRYSGRTFQPRPWHPLVESLRDRVGRELQKSDLPHAEFNSVLLNRYASGEQRMGWHSDDEPELGKNPVVASVSLGSERPLRFRDRAKPPSNAFNVWLPRGSLLLMGPGAQAQWQHALAPRAIEGVRINLTFRQII